MKLTIVADDTVVIVDGESASNVDLAQLDPTIHAVQWYGDYGEVEYKTVFTEGKLVKPNNRLITSISEFDFVVAAWSEAKALAEAERLAEEAADAEASSVSLDPTQPE